MRLVPTLRTPSAPGQPPKVAKIHTRTRYAAAIHSNPGHRRFPRALQVIGVFGCALLVVTLPATSVVTGIAVFGVGVAYRGLRRRSQHRD